MVQNELNTPRGKDFQIKVQAWFNEKNGSDFELEIPIMIGMPAKQHKFDIVNRNLKYVIECKRYTWTETGNVPHGKIRGCNEAAFFLSFLPDDFTKYIVMFRSVHPKTKATLAEYYYKHYSHLLVKHNIIVAEFDPDTKDLHEIGQD